MAGRPHKTAQRIAPLEADALELAGQAFLSVLRQYPDHPDSTDALNRAWNNAVTAQNDSLLAESQVLGDQGGAQEEEHAEGAENQPQHVHRVAPVRVACG